MSYYYLDPSVHVTFSKYVSHIILFFRRHTFMPLPWALLNIVWKPHIVGSYEVKCDICVHTTVYDKKIIIWTIFFLLNDHIYNLLCWLAGSFQKNNSWLWRWVGYGIFFHQMLPICAEWNKSEKNTTWFHLHVECKHTHTAQVNKQNKEADS